MPKFTRSIGRLAKLSTQNLSRNLLLSIATTAMIGLILFVFNIIMVLNGLTQGSLEELNKKIDLILYLNSEASIYEITDMINDLKAYPNVIEVTYTSSESALQDFLATYPEKENPFSTYGIENPLPQSIKIVTSDPSHHQDVTDYLAGTPYGKLLQGTESLDENQEIVARLLSLTAFTKKLLIGVILTFVFGTVLMVMNAINLSIFTRKTEIKIMQLVGAKPRMIFLPFIFEGVVYSIIANFFSLFLLLFFLQSTGVLDNLSLNNFNIAVLAPLELIGSILIGVLASYSATYFYLRHNLLLEDS